MQNVGIVDKRLQMALVQNMEVTTIARMNACGNRVDPAAIGTEGCAHRRFSAAGVRIQFGERPVQLALVGPFLRSGMCRSRRKDMFRVELVSPASPLHMLGMPYRRPIFGGDAPPRKGPIMTIEMPASASSRLNDESVQRTNRDQTAAERCENEGLAEAPKGPDPIAWVGQIRRSSRGDDIVSKHPEERDIGQEALAETTDLERRVLVLEQILQALIAHMAETEPRFIDRLSATFTDPIRVAHEEQDYVDTASYAERFIREIVRLGERPAGLRIRLPRNFLSPERAERRLVAPPEIPDRPALVFELRYRSGIWEVTRDGRFYGDFLSEREALDGAQAAVRSVVASGGFATLSDAVIEL